MAAGGSPRLSRQGGLERPGSARREFRGAPGGWSKPRVESKREGHLRRGLADGRVGPRNQSLFE